MPAASFAVGTSLGEAERRSRLTAAPIVLSIVATVVTWHTSADAVFRWLTIDAFVGSGEDRVPAHADRFHDIRHGQFWRLVTPILVHASFLHLAMNLVWLFVLGRMIEALAGRWTLLGLTLTLAVGSDVGQYLWHGPLFCGMSGVVYGLLGYAWIRERLDPESGFVVPLGFVLMMAVWFVYSFMLEHAGSAAHAFGLAIGLGWGALAGRARTAPA